MMNKNKKKIKIIIILILLMLLIIVMNSIAKKENIISNAVKKIMKNETTVEIVETSTQGLVLHAEELIKESTEETNMAHNTEYLQELIDEVSNAGGGVVHIPAGTFYFTSGGINARGSENYVIKSRDNVLVEGEGTNEATGTILKPYGTPKNGLDMFYYNQYRDTQGKDTTYIVNADFRNFVIDSEKAVGETYNTSGKGFMLNLYKDCDWENVVVKNTDGTGFGMDNPINCTVKNCIAINCGKNANTNSAGASGFGIGTGFSEEDSILISDCTSIGNKKYGFFFEHQGRFQTLYRATKSESLVVSNCKAVGNLYNFGGARANDVSYENCTSLEEDANSVNRAAFYFEEISRRVHLTNCKVEKTFTDLTDTTKYYYEPAYWALNNGISNGTTVTNFGADELCTRTYALEFLYRIAGRPGEVIFGNWKSEANAENFKTNFSDLTTDASCIDAIRWAEDEGLLDFLGTEFLPNKACTKDVFLTILWKYARAPIVESGNDFPDVEEGAYYEDAVNWAVSKGIVKGYANGKLGPTEECTRGQIITYLYRFYNSLNEYSITYNLNQGKIVKENPASYTVGGNSITLNAPVKVGYTFDGWTGSNGTIPEKEITINKNDTGNKIYTANWTANNYTLVFDSNGGSGKMQKEFFKYDCPQILSPNKFEYEGYKFKGWNTKKDGTGTTYNDKQAVNNLTTISNKEITLYAQWEFQDPNNRENIFIGDSIYVEMKNIVGGNETWVASRGQGLDWVKNTALPSIENQIGDKTNVIIGICLNDLFNKYLNNGNVDVDRVVEMYAEYFNTKAIEYTQLGAKVYFMGPGPVDDSKIDFARKANNADIVNFNNKIQTKLEGITFINLYSNIIDDFNAKDPDLLRDDGTHGTALYYSKVYNIIKKSLGQDYVPTFEAFNNMTDISADAKYIVPLKWGYKNVFIDPISETKFGPNNTISRADAITLIWRSQGIPYYNCEVAFSDVSKNDSYYDAVMWGVGNNIVAGTTASTFEPNNTCERGHFIMFLWRMAGEPIVTTSNNFTDVEDGKKYTDAINWAVSERIIDEDLNGEFRPEEACTRAEAITFAYNYYNKYQTYKVEHYKQNIDETYPEKPEETEIYEGKIGQEVSPKVKTYEGFTKPEVLRVVITEDAQVIKYYYERNKYNVTVTKGTGIGRVSGEGSYKYEEAVTLGALIKEGYENVTWTGDYEVNTFSMPAKDVTLNVDAQAIKYTITYNLAGGTLEEKTTEYTIETEDIVLQVPTKKGYTFLGWTGSNGDIPEKEVTIVQGTTGNLTYTANWEVQKTTYTVEHYKQNIDETYPEKPEETETFRANMGTEITPETKIYEGFTAPNKQTEKLANDGSTVIKYYYTRNSYTVTVTKGEGIQNVIGMGSYKYEQNVKIYASLKEGYENMKWTGDYTTNIFNMPSKNVRLNVNAQEIKCTITSSKYNISQSYISDISDKTTVQKFKSSIETNATEIKILNKNNEEMNSNGIIGTGMTLILKLGNKTESLKLVINGDTNGDGYANIKDILAINKHRLNKTTLKNEYLLAGDVTGDGLTDMKDILKINKYRLKKIDTL